MSNKPVSKILCVLSVLFAVYAPSALAEKVVVLDLQRAIMMTDAAREKMKGLESQKEYAETHKKAESSRQQMMKMQEALQKEGPTWSVDKRNNHLQEMDFLRKDFDLAAQKLQTAQQELMRELMRSMEPKVKQSLEQLIKEQQIDLVIDKNAAVFAGPSADITMPLLDKLNKAK